MRSSICYKYNETNHCLARLNESKAGVYYIVSVNTDDYHCSYHHDGNFHMRTHKNSPKRMQADRTPINSINGIEFFASMSIPIVRSRFTSMSAYKPRNNAENLVQLNPEFFENHNSINVALALMDTGNICRYKRETDEFAATQEGIKISNFLIFDLDHYPNHKLGITVYSSNVQGRIKS